MKKLITLAVFLSLTACSKEEAAPTPAPTPEPAPAPTPAPAAGADIQPEQADAVVAELEKEIDSEIASETN